MAALEVERLERVLADSLALVEKQEAERKLAEVQKQKAMEAARQKRLAEERKLKEKQAQATVQLEDIPISKPVAKPVAQSGAQIKFDRTTYNFGTVEEGDLVKYNFTYTNTGKEDLLILNASASCGCTAPGFSFLPLKPGQGSEISVAFNSKGKIGPQRPLITILTNGSPSKQVLTLEGTVVKKAEKPEESKAAEAPAPEEAETPESPETPEDH